MGVTAADVRAVIDTDLSDSDIRDVLDRVQRDVARAYDGDDDVSFGSDLHRDDFEAVLCALRIVSGRDRRANSKSLDDGETSAAKTYEASEVAYLQARVRQLDPADVFSAGGATTSSPAHVRSVSDE